MSETAAKLAPQRSSALNDAVRDAAKPKGRVTAKAEADINTQITTNPFFNVVFAEETSVKEKADEIARLMTTTLDIKKDREAAKQFELFREWLATQRTAHAKQVVAVSNVEAMSELQAVLKDMNEDLLSFNNLVNPIMDIIDSVYQLRTNGMVLDAFKEIKEDEKREEELQQKLSDIAREMDDLAGQIRTQEGVKVTAAGKRGFLGLGGLTKAAQEEIAAADIAIEKANRQIADLQRKTTDLKAAKNDASGLGEMKIHKDRLRELLDMTKDENRDKMVALRIAAEKFIATSEERTGSLRGQFDGMAKQIHLAEDTNTQMTRAYAIVNEGLKQAAEANKTKRDEINVEIDADDLVAQMTRDEQLRALDGHVDLLARSRGEAMSTYGDLTQSALRIGNMKQSTEQQINTARMINTDGVAATADRLASVLTAVASAGMNEASQASISTLNEMRKSTQEITSREAIRVATGIDRINDQMSVVFDELLQIRDVQQTATGIAMNGMIAMNENMQRIRDEADKVQADMREYLAVASSADDGAAGSTAAPAARTTGFPGVGA